MVCCWRMLILNAETRRRTGKTEGSSVDELRAAARFGVAATELGFFHEGIFYSWRDGNGWIVGGLFDNRNEEDAGAGGFDSCWGFEVGCGVAFWGAGSGGEEFVRAAGDVDLFLFADESEWETVYSTVWNIRWREECGVANDHGFF
jgi:hypothetical protein